MQAQDTIVAQATPAGRAGVGVVRLSGPKAYAIAKRLSRKDDLPIRTAVYSPLYDSKAELMDEVILLYFKAPHSFTGEDVVEFQGHGSPVLQDYIIKACIQEGARLARPGEYSERAFLNDKMDLSQAEAVADLIDAQSLTAAKMALRSLQGEFSKSINALNEQLVYLRTYVEASIDFPDEEIDFLADGKILAEAAALLKDIANIRHNAAQGVLMREGLSVVIAGKPNAGKSTLINRLAQREVAIVTDIAGTTRDVMREHIVLDDLPIHIIDTAGLCETTDVVEQEGIRRAWQEVRQADCVLMIVDVREQSPPQDLLLTIQAAVNPGVPILIVFNKSDLQGHIQAEEGSSIHISAKTGEGLSLLIAAIKKAVAYQPSEGLFSARRRHLEALDEAKAFLNNGLEQAKVHKAYELLAEDLRLAHQALCSITGEFSSDDLLGQIFSSFCIGK